MKTLTALAVVALLGGCAIVTSVAGVISSVRSEIRYKELEDRVLKLEFPVDSDMWLD